MSRRVPPRICGKLRAGLLLGLLALLWPALATAATRAWLDRGSVEQGEAVTLNIQTDQDGVAPDYSPLATDFELGPPQRARDAGGRGGLFGIALTPRRTGVLNLPSLRVGGERTPALVLRVLPASTDVPQGDVFIQTLVDSPAPYVQQAVGVSVRLHYAIPLISGELSQDAPEGASLQRVGEDVNSFREVGGRRYQVVERRYLLVPERSGPLQLPPARFRGRGSPRFFDDFFGNDRSLAAEGPARVLQVQAQPPGAPQPWLPLRALQLRYVAAPSRGRAGESLELEVEAVAQGTTAALFPELPLPRPQGAQLFAERARTEERFVDGSPQLTMRRRFALVPQQAGHLLLPALEMEWWDAAANAARRAHLPALELEIEQGTAAAPPAPTPEPPDPEAEVALPAPAGMGRLPWPWLALGLGLLWLLTLAWALWLRGRRLPESGDGGVAQFQPGPASASLAELRRQLDAGSLENVVAVLRRMHRPPLQDLEQVLARLGDAAQRQALERMRRALWAGEGDPAQARQELRAALRGGPRWRQPEAGAADPLPPLYPPASREPPIR